MVGIDRSYLIGIEKGTRNASVNKLIRIAHGLDVPLATLFEGVDAMREYDGR